MPSTQINTSRICFVKANWHADIVNQALAGFLAELKDQGHDEAQVKTFDIPGAFEGPLLAKRLIEGDVADLVVVAALVVDGGIYRHDFVASAVVDGLMQVQLETGKPVLSVSLTPHHFHDGQEHHDYFFEHFFKKGREAAKAALMVLGTEI